jgi:NAD(P)H dehydrogenase (quinone)
MSIVVTGATGHLGRLIVDGLLRDGVAPAEIVAAGRNTAKLTELGNQGVRVVQMDYSDPESMAVAFAGASTLMLVSSSEVGQRATQHAAAIDAARLAGIGHVVYTSAPKADTTTLVLAPEHKITEELIRASGIPFTILRNGWYTENYVGTAAQARETGVVAASVGDGLVSSASRVDYADAAVAVLTGVGHENKVYELSGDIAWSHTELAAVLADILGRDVVYTSLSDEDHLAALQAAGLDAGTAGFVVALDADTRNGLLGETSGELTALIGRPTTPLREGLVAAL